MADGTGKGREDGHGDPDTGSREAGAASPWVQALAKGLGAVGTGLMAGANVVGRAAATAYRAVDPDVRRHLAELPLMSFALFPGARPEVEPGEPDGHPPLVFVHGLGGTGAEFRLHAWYLGRRGRRRGYAIRFTPDQGIEDMAAALAEFVQAVRRATGEERVDLVAHSMGGVVARLAVLEHGLQESVGTLVTLGSPHGGTHPARYVATKKLLDLRPDNPVIRRMAAARWPASVRGVAMWSRADMLVLPAESAAPAGFEHVDLSPFTHYAYLWHPQGWAAVAEVLAPWGSGASAAGTEPAPGS